MAKKIPMPGLTPIEAGILAIHAKNQLLEARWPNYKLLWKKIFEAAGGQAAVDQHMDHVEKLTKDYEDRCAKRGWRCRS